jgi:hypothetical protein
VPYGESMLAVKEVIQERLNDAGTLMTGEVLERFDTDGSPIMLGGSKWTSKGKVAKPYQTPYGEVVIERHVYQSSRGGRLFCPLEREARIILTATPRFAKVLSSKYSEMGSSRVIKDLESNHGRGVARSFVQKVVDGMGAVAFAKEEDWHYKLPALEKPVHTIAVGLDGTCVLLTDEGYRQAMVGTLVLYDRRGERQHTIYTAAAPEYGKATFLARLENEIARVKVTFPQAQYIGLADGAKENWEFLNRHTDTHLLDFWHAAGYLGRAAEVRFAGKKQTQAKETWLEEACHDLKHKLGTANRLLREFKTWQTEAKLSTEDRQELEQGVTYFRNHKAQMSYAQALEQHLPIGSGMTEAACKGLVKQRLGGAGMKWGGRGAAVVLSLRALNYTPGRWDQFWNKIDRYGFPLAA